MTCPNCKAYKGLTLQHSTDDCPIRDHITCRKCCQTGHMTHLCTENWSHWERPTTMEELIPFHIRNRYRITSATPVTFKNPRDSSTTYELHKMNEIIIPDDHDKIADLAKTLKITPAKLKNVQRPGGRYSTEEYTTAIEKWGKDTGRRIIPNKEMREKQKNTIVV
uniref:Uncharacterized protein n=1 Tax=viral metagenome TaxID=1070528 RepID=A0A6C0LNX4_9ZZZZ